jgi:hypothetical protein
MDQRSISNGAAHWNKALCATAIFGSVLYVTHHAPNLGLTNFPLFSEGVQFGLLNECVRRVGMMAGKGLVNLVPERNEEGKLYYPDGPRPLKWSSLLTGFALSAVMLTAAAPQTRKGARALVDEAPRLGTDVVELAKGIYHGADRLATGIEHAFK